MNFTATKSELSRAITLCQGIIDRRNTLPILSNVLLEKTDDGRLAMIANNMEMRLTVIITATHGGGTFPITLPCQTFNDIIKKSATSDISLTAKEDTARITAGKTHFRLGTFPAEDYPIFPRMPAAVSFKIQAKILLDMIDNAKNSMSSEETRHYLNGIFFENTNLDGIRAVATDGHRLALAEESIENVNAEDAEHIGAEFPNIIIPARAVGELRKMLADRECAVAVTLTEHYAEFDMAADGINFITKLIDGTYPDYGRVIPKNNTHIAEVDTAKLLTAIALVSTIAPNKKFGIKLQFDTGKITLSCGHEGNTGVVEVDAVWNHEPLTIGFNFTYLADALGKMTPTCQIALPDTDNGAAILRCVTDGAPHSTGLHLVMSCRV